MIIAAGQPRLEIGRERCGERELAAQHIAVARHRRLVDHEVDSPRVDLRTAEIGGIGERRTLRRDVAVPQHVGTLEGLRELAGMGGEAPVPVSRSEEHTSELQSLMRNSYAV